MSAAPITPNNYLTLPEPTILEPCCEYYRVYLGNQMFSVMMNTLYSKTAHFYVEENITTVGDPPQKSEELSEYRENLPKDHNKLPRHAVIIMTKEWVIVVRPEPQQTEQNVQIQAHHYWHHVENMLPDDKHREGIDTIICWVFYPEGEIMSKIHDDEKPLPAYRQMKIYKTVFEEGMKKMGWLSNRVFKSKPYYLGKTTVSSSETNYRSQIVIHHPDLFQCETFGFESQDYEACFSSGYKALGFPSVSLITLAVTRRADGDIKAVRSSRMVWPTQELIDRNGHERIRCW
ncbi:hypothetical protein TMatcc_005834 [Talaromyces marneffei ATCC 18224]